MTLLQFLRQARQVHLQFISGALSEPPVYVLGNPSADLDSIISAILYSYCASSRLPTKTHRPHVPLLNLPTISAGPELYRLRPEFTTALHLSTNDPALKPDERFERSPESAGKLLREHVVTIADFAQSLKEQCASKKITADVTLVDWNALPNPVEGQKGSGSVAGLLDVIFRTVGCIDHHVDEDFVPRDDSLSKNQPVIIKVGPGSCSSLVSNEMVQRGLWAAKADASSSSETAQIAKLALAAILIDTTNLTAEGKVTDVDVQAVDFLCKQVAKDDSAWHREAFFEKILSAKKNSLDLLTLPEILDRDYKDWTETTSSGKDVKLGFCSSVKPICWIVEKAGSVSKFVDAVRSFAAQKELDIVVVMTSFTHGDDKFARELFLYAKHESEAAADGAKVFVTQAGTELGLDKWSSLHGGCPNSTEEKVRSVLNGIDSDSCRQLWLQKNTTASRKQVAPLLREAVAKL